MGHYDITISHHKALYSRFYVVVRLATLPDMTDLEDYKIVSRRLMSCSVKAVNVITS
jgi:hypothetical protein